MLSGIAKFLVSLRSFYDIEGAQNKAISLSLFFLSQLTQLGAIYCTKMIDFNMDLDSSAYVLIFVLILCLVSHAYIWQKLLMLVPLSKVYPATAIQFPLLLLMGIYMFDEILTLNKIFGVALIVAGVFLLVGKKYKI